MYTNIDTIFDNSVFDNIFNKVFEAQPAITWPINLYTEGDNEVIEIAVVGKEKEDIKIQSKIGTDGIVHLTIDISDAKKDSEKSTDRQYLIRKVKNGAGHIDVPVSDVYDLTKLTASISKGLLTVKIPKAESKKAQEYTIA